MDFDQAMATIAQGNPDVANAISGTIVGLQGQLQQVQQQL